MDIILIILKKENGPRASSAPALGLNTIIFKYVYWYMKQISGERLQDHWSSGLHVPDSSLYIICVFYSSRIRTLVAMVTLSFHRLIMGKWKLAIFSSPEPKAHR